MAKRTKIIVKWKDDGEGWRFGHQGDPPVSSFWRTRKGAITDAARYCRQQFADYGTPLELIVLNKTDGKVSEHRSYGGRDPVRYKG